jgi:hypothetical protein
MGVRLRVFLTRQQDRTLFELRTAQGVPQRTKDRAEALRLSAHGWYVEKIAAYLNWEAETVRQTIHRWQTCMSGGTMGCSRSWSFHDGGRKLTDAT